MENEQSRKINLDIAVISLALICSFLLFKEYDVLEKIVEISRDYEHLEIDEIFSTAIVLMFCMSWFSYRRWQEAKSSIAVIALKNEEIEKAITEIKRLEGIIPICMYCKQIRDDKGAWSQIEEYISEHSDAQFSHGVCETCADKYFTKPMHAKRTSDSDHQENK